jgi:pyruvate-formate lyase-activating enzyme
MSNLDDLNARVTDAILRAERLPADSFEALAAFREVWQLEAAIASITPPDDVEGEIARVGAVTAALSAREPLKALQLIDQYRHETLAHEVLEKLNTLQAEAQAELSNVRAATVRPVRFKLRAA